MGSGRTTKLTGRSAGEENEMPNSNSIKVCIRVKPLGDSESCINIENACIVELDKAGDTKTFKFDFVGHEKMDQLSIFNHIAKPIADTCMQGYNGTIFAYGQTGAGKTYTI